MNTRIPHPSAHLRRGGLIFVLCLGLGASLSAQVVTNTADSGSGTLRAVIASAVSGATITFAANLSGQTITLTSDQLDVSKNLKIDASALPGGIAINGNHSERIFNFETGTTNTLTSLTLTNGYTSGHSGGAISTGGNPFLTLNNCTLAGNIVTNGNGGGIYNDAGTVTLNNCTLTGNSASGSGGGIYNDVGGTLTLNNCTLAGNSATNSGGGIFSSGTATLTNSIVAGNTASDSSSNIFGVFSGANNLTNGNPGLAPLGNYGGPTRTMPPLPGSPAIDAGSDTVTNFLATDQRGVARKVGAHVDIGAVEALVINLNPVPNSAVFSPQPTLSWNGPAGATYEVFFGTTSGNLTSLGATGTNTSITVLAPLTFGTYIWRVDTTLGSVTYPGLEFTFYHFVVETTADSGPGSLRQEILDAATNSGGAAILFDPSLSGSTITLTSGELVVSNNFKIDASALPGGITINGNHTSRIFNFASGATNTLTSLTLSNGIAPGKLTTSTGGAIWVNSGFLTLNNCTLAGNSAHNGGGIYNVSGTLTINSCTIANNNSTGDGDGGGIGNGGALTLNNSTLSGNSAGASGGGIFSSGTATLTNSIVAGNTASDSSSNIFGVFSGANNLTNGNPGLAPLGNYGGPTRTMPPLPGSPAIDAGSDTVTNFLATDQRGVARKVGAHVDIGAVEALVINLNPVPNSAVFSPQPTLSWNGPAGATYEVFFGTTSGNLTSLGATGTNTSITVLAPLTFGTYIWRVDTTVGGVTYNGLEFAFHRFVVDTTADAGPDSLRQAVLDANTFGDQIIFFDPSLSGSTITLTSGELVVTNSLNIDASALPGGITINGNHTSRIFNFENGTTNMLTGLTLTNSYGPENNLGGTIYMTEATLTLSNCTLVGNIITNGNGGGIYNDAGTLTLNNCSITGNFSGGAGDGIYNDAGTLTLNNCSITGNSSGDNGLGGGIFNYGTLTLNNCTLSGNHRGIYTDAGPVELNNCTLSGNYTYSYGGGIYDDSSSTVTLNNCTLSGNSAGIGGGGIYNAGTLTLNNCTLSGNYAGIDGGIDSDIHGAKMTLNNSIVAGNNANDILEGFLGANNLVNYSGNPRLAPLGNYGGPTQTMPPLPGSPAIDAGGATAFTNDQRGFARVGAPDIGAAEFQGASDVALFWSTDWDGDGNLFGLELALGTDTLVADPNAPGLPAPYPPAGGNGIQFGFNSVATNYAAWVVSRSLNLSVPNSFVEIYRFDGPTGITTTTNAPVSVTQTTNSISIIDNSVPLPPAAFYRLSIEPRP